MESVGPRGTDARGRLDNEVPVETFLRISWWAPLFERLEERKAKKPADA